MRACTRATLKGGLQMVRPVVPFLFIVSVLFLAFSIVDVVHLKLFELSRIAVPFHYDIVLLLFCLFLCIGVLAFLCYVLFVSVSILCSSIYGYM
jgi:hypothetical protein